MSVLVLFSGGVDSTFLCHQASSEGLLRSAMFMDYGQAAARMERRAVELWSAREDTEVIHAQVQIHGTDQHMNTGAGSPGLRILPGSDLVMLSHAANYAATHGINRVWYGATVNDADYPDCLPEWVDALNALTTRDLGVSIEAPLISMSKREIMQEADRLGIFLSSAWSCYQPVGSSPCGECHSCEERISATVRPVVRMGNG